MSASRRRARTAAPSQSHATHTHLLWHDILGTDYNDVESVLLFKATLWLIIRRQPDGAGPRCERGRGGGQSMVMTDLGQVKDLEVGRSILPSNTTRSSPFLFPACLSHHSFPQGCGELSWSTSFSLLFRPFLPLALGANISPPINHKRPQTARQLHRLTTYDLKMKIKHFLSAPGSSTPASSPP